MPPSGNMYPTVQANRDMKKTSLLAACILALAMSMGSGAAVAKTPPDQLIIGMNMNNLLTLDPAAMTGNEVVGIVVNLYDSLVELDPEQLTTVKPALDLSSARRRQVSLRQPADRRRCGVVDAAHPASQPGPGLGMEILWLQ